MPNFVVGDKVRVTEALAAEVRQSYYGTEFKMDELDLAIAERRPLTIASIRENMLYPLGVNILGDSTEWFPMHYNEVELIED